MPSNTVHRISQIVGNVLLAADLHSSITSAIDYPVFSSTFGNSVWKIFQRSLNAAIRDIENHPRGKLFLRLLEFGPINPGDPIKPVSNGETVLSDPECAECVEFIYSHMVNRFKGELAEMLALQPCIELMKDLQKQNHLPGRISLYWGDDIKEPRLVSHDKQYGVETWSGFSKGADGVIAQLYTHEGKDLLKVFGIVEVKSMRYSLSKVNKQISSHANRLRGGINLCGKEWTRDNVFITHQFTNPQNESDFLRIMVIPSSWKLSRNWKYQKKEDKKFLVPPPQVPPPVPTTLEEIQPGMWKITLSWSEEVLHQAAYEMTFWYMSQVGHHIYKNNPLPKGWEEMTPEEAGYNAIKMMLYYIPLRPITERHRRKATKLFNVYSFGYPLGADSNEMLWPEDILSS